MHKGSCLCSAVSFEVAGPLLPPTVCHCTQCRKQSGHCWAATDMPSEAVTIHGADHLTWFRASEQVERGFCSTCGSFLFWKPLQANRISIAMGAFEQPTEAHLARHIYVTDKGDYYDIADGLPQKTTR